MKHIVITGGTKGIGRAIAERFAQDKNHLIICARSNDALQEIKTSFSQQYPNCTLTYEQADLATKEGVLAFANTLIDLKLVPDILINNAGSYLPGSVHNEDDGTLETMLNVNLFSAYHLTRALLPSMMKVAQGHIINMCSIASLQAYANGGAYSISKFALLGFSKNLREEMKPYNIKVTAVMPGATMSASWEGADIDPARIMEANDIADMIYATTKLSAQAVVEDIILRPQLGDL